MSDALEPEKIVTFKPVKVGDLELSQIVLREPTGAEMAACDDKSGWAYTIALISQVSGQVPAVIGKLGVSTLRECTAYLNPFLTSVPPAGGDA